MAQQEKTKIVLGTATPGGGFPAYGWPYAEVLNETDPTLAIEPINTKGSNENVVSLDQDKIDLGLVTGEVTYEAINGLGRPKASNIRIINATYSQAGMFMVRADSPYRSISDLKGKSIAWGAASSGFIVLGRYVMDGLGLDMKNDFDAHLLEKAGDGPPMVLDGRAADLMTRLGWSCAYCAAREAEPLSLAAKRHGNPVRAVIACFRALADGGPSADQVAHAARQRLGRAIRRLSQSLRGGPRRSRAPHRDRGQGAPLRRSRGRRG